MSNERVINAFGRAYNQKLEASTLKQYQWTLGKFFQHTGEQIEQVSPQRVRKWVLDMQEKGYAEQTINYRITALKTFFTYCFEESIVQKNPMEAIEFLINPEKPMYYLTPEQLEQLRQLVSDNLEKRLMVELLYTTGMRISELLAVERADINWEERYIYIPKTKRKKQRIVCFTKTCEMLLAEYLAKRTDDLPFVFVAKWKSGPPTKRAIQYHFEAYAEKLGFAISPHTLRHTFAAHLAQKGMPLAHLQTLLGHETPQQTQHYARLYHDAQKEIYDYWME